MAKLEYRAPLDALYTERTKLDKVLGDIMNNYQVVQDRLQKLRTDQQHFREGKEGLSNTNTNKIARKVFDDNIAACQKQILEIQKELEEWEKKRVVASSKSKAIEKSIKELQNA